MDPGRAAMIAGGGGGGRRDHRDDRRDDRRSDRRDDRRDYRRGDDRRGDDRRGGDYRRDPTGPRRDNYNRVSKPAERSARPGGNGNRNEKNGGYMTEEQLSERFVAQEDSFVLKQSKSKADIRVRERRAKPIDLLAFHLRFVDEDHDTFEDKDTDAEIVYPLPEAVIQATADGGDDASLKELEDDIKSFRTLEKNKANRRYWQAVLVLCRMAREESKEKQYSKDGAGGGGGHVVLTDVDKILHTKTLRQLEEMETKIEDKLNSDETMETDHWQMMLKRLQVWKARAVLAEVNEAAKAKRAMLRAEAAAARAAAGGGADNEPVEAGEDEDEESAAVVTAADIKAVTASTSAAPPPGTERFAAVAQDDFSQATKALYDREVARGVSENEEIFAAEEVVPSASSTPKWADKYRPRKPRYFNRVQMGYEWNKYNQTHYDHDNPPPKVVQGYKFNIFYPELIDKTKAPTYHITREGGRRKGESFAPAGEEDTCLIRFSAGPPYEDIAFRIVDREWDYSAKRERGFKSVFEKGILQLHFQFKKIYYRK
ncbi:hypothetical protein SBRCBS47491_004407 [Sporothrix bragantina]|uniref:Splicing factor Cactin n=1 Tax=Sporothrix bragantina TaxID=671064 RepID=A0ABP0BNQ6_9PEZI